MGSLNDISVPADTESWNGRRANKTLSRLLDACYREAVLADEPWWGRMLWAALSMGNIGGVPPRIRRAFK
jgi:hypothetical protein